MERLVFSPASPSCSLPISQIGSSSSSWKEYVVESLCSIDKNKIILHLEKGKNGNKHTSFCNFLGLQRSTSYAIANVLKVCSGECFGIFAQTCVWTMIQKSAGVEVWYISSICAMCFWNMRYYKAASTMLWQLGLFAIEIMMIIRNHHHRPLQYLPGSTSDPVPSDLHRCHRFSET